MNVYRVEDIVVWEFGGDLPDSIDNSNKLVDSFQKGLAFYQQTKNKKVLWLNDTEYLTFLGAHLQRELDDFVNANVIEHRLEGKMAFIQPHDSLGRSIVKWYVECAIKRFWDAYLDFPIEIFTSKQEAINWLKLPLHSLQAA